MEYTEMRFLIILLKSKSAAVRVNAAGKLVKFKRVSVIPLIKSMKDEDEKFRYRASEVLWRIFGGDAYWWNKSEFSGHIAEAQPRIDRERIVSALVKAANYYFSYNPSDADKENCALVLKAIAELGYEESVKPLIKLSEHPGYHEYKIPDLLPAIGKSAVKPLIRLRENKDRDMHITVIDTLGEIGGEDAAVYLRNSLSNDEDWARSSAALALEKTGCLRVEDLLKLLKDKDKWLSLWAMEKLAEINAPGTKEKLFVISKGDDFIMRDKAAELMGDKSVKLIENIPFLGRIL